MIFGAHLVVFSTDAEADRAFLSDVLGFDSVDAGGGWLIFALPAAEAALHPAEAPAAELYLMTDDLAADMRSLAERGVELSDVEEARLGHDHEDPAPERRRDRPVSAEAPDGDRAPPG